MAKFTKNEKVNLESNVDIEIDISVEEFYTKMGEQDSIEMHNLLRGDIPDYEAHEVMENIEDKAKFYKDLAYHIGVSDVEHLDALITGLQYWRKK